MSYSISVLGDNLPINQIIKTCGEELNVETGFVGQNQDNLLEYLVSTYRFHILFVLPSRRNMEVLGRVKLVSNLNIHVIIVGSVLPEDNIAMVILSGISGFITMNDLNCEEISFIIESIHAKGYVANRYIPTEWWNNVRSKRHHIPDYCPSFSKTELEVATYLANGFTISQIASFRKKTESSIRFHIKNLLVKSKTYSLREFIVKSITNLWVKVNRNNSSQNNSFIALIETSGA